MKMESCDETERQSLIDEIKRRIEYLILTDKISDEEKNKIAARFIALMNAGSNANNKA